MKIAEHEDCKCKKIFDSRGIFIFKDKSNCFIHSPATAKHNSLLDQKLDQLGRRIYLCWLCNKRLTYHNEILIFRLVTLPNGTAVKMHKTCAEDFKIHPDTYWGT